MRTGKRTDLNWMTKTGAAGWVDGVTASWADGRIGDAEFIRALQFLIWQEAIVV